jgi:uncharacterized membrane protein
LFDLQHHRRAFVGLLIWVVVFLVAAVAEVAVGRVVRTAAGPVAQGLLGSVIVLGAAGGAVWQQQRTSTDVLRADSQTVARRSEED